MIIGVCGMNFCSLIADKRKVNPNDDFGSYHTADDNFQKIFKLNERVLVGAVGMFIKNNLLCPFDNYKDTRMITLQNASDSIVEYLSARKKIAGLRCGYMIGGREDNGKFLIRTFQYSPALPDIVVKDYRAKNIGGGKSIYGVTVMLPAGLAGREDEYINQVGTAINSSTSHKEMTKKCEGIIRDIAEKDATVGRRTQVLSIM